MIVKILGIFDFIAAGIFWVFGMFHLTHFTFLISVAGYYLLAKGAIFGLIFGDVASIIDVICAFCILSLLFIELPLVVVVVITFFILQKAFFSIIA